MSRSSLHKYIACFVEYLPAQWISNSPWLVLFFCLHFTAVASKVIFFRVHLPFATEETTHSLIATSPSLTLPLWFSKLKGVDLTGFWMSQKKEVTGFDILVMIKENCIPCSRQDLVHKKMWLCSGFWRIVLRATEICHCFKERRKENASLNLNLLQDGDIPCVLSVAWQPNHQSANISVDIKNTIYSIGLVRMSNHCKGVERAIRCGFNCRINVCFYS